MVKLLIIPILCLLPLLVVGQVPTHSRLIHRVDSLLKESSKLSRAGKFEEAIRLTEIATAETLSQLDTNTVSYADCQHQLGAISLDMNQFDKAEPPLLKGLQMRKQLLGNQHKAVSTSLNSLGILYGRMGRLDDSELYFREAMAINRVVYGPRHFNYAMGIQNMATIFKNNARFEEAEALYKEAISILVDTIGRAHPLVAMTEMNLGLSQMDQGKYDEAEKALTSSLAICQEVLPSNHPYHLMALVNLSIFYKNISRYKESIDMIEEAKKICRTIYGEESLREGEYCSTAGLIYKALGEYEKAETELLRSASLISKSYGEAHVRYAQALANLAIFYAGRKQYDTALRYFHETRKKYEELELMVSPDYALVVLAQGRMYEELEDIAQAKTHFAEALNILERTECKQRYEYSDALTDLARVCFLNQDTDEVPAHYRNLVTWHQSYMATSARHLSEQDLLSLRYRQEAQFAQVLTFCYQTPQPNLHGALYDISLMTKNFLLEKKMTILQAIKQADSTTLATYQKWLGTQRLLADEYTKAAPLRAEVEQLELAANQQERRLTQQLVQGFNAPGWQEVQAQLQPAEATIEFVRFPLKTAGSEDSLWYAALLLRPGMKQPQFIPLFEEQQLKAILPLNVQNRLEYVNQLYQNEKLTQLIWQPIAEQLKGVSTIYVSPAGLLYRISLSALPWGAQGTLSDEFNLITVGSTRQIADANFRSSQEKRKTIHEATLFGAIIYEPQADASPAKPTEDDLYRSQRGLVDLSQVDSTLRGGSWNYLRHSERELNNLADILRRTDIAAQMVKGYDASEESVKIYDAQHPSPSLLHISTHGYFFPDPDLKSTPDGPEPVFVHSQHPLIRSGLIMASANYAWKNGHPLPGREDGVLTAYEISQLNLSGTELAVLSACETGLGDIVGNEGVYGLQRAFRIAGVKNVLMSLWQVPDYQTQELMTLFYKKWLEDHLPLPQALAAAQQEMQAIGYEPYYWAGWVLVE